MVSPERSYTYALARTPGLYVRISLLQMGIVTV